MYNEAALICQALDRKKRRVDRPVGLEPSVVTPEEIEQLLATRYRFGPVQQIDELAGGDGHCYHLVTADRELVLKEMARNGMNRPEMEPVVVAQLAHDGIPTACFYKTVEGSYVWEWKGKAFHLQQFIPGQIYGRNMAPAWLLSDSAELLGRVHRSLSQLPPLDEGIGPAWYQGFHAEEAQRSYQRTESLAEEMGQPQMAVDARYRRAALPLLERLSFDFGRLTRRNTHGDYRVQQLICDQGHIRAVIDLTTACVHPAIWEVLRSYTFADPQCAEGEIHVEHLKEYIARYLVHGYLTAYDLRMMPAFYLYQLLRSNYIQQYLDADVSGQGPALGLATWSTKLCRWLEEHGETLSEELVLSF